MSAARRDQWSERLGLLRRIGSEALTIADYARADRARALRRHAQERWAVEIFREVRRP